MKKIIRLTESDLIKIIKLVIKENINTLNEVDPPSYEKDPSPEKLDLTKIPYKELSIMNPTQGTVETNKNILYQLQSKNLIDPTKLNFKIEDKDFLSKISHELKKKGITPYLKPKKDKTGVTGVPGFKFSIPNIGMEVQMEKGYFGVSETLPFMKNIQFSASYKPQSKDTYGLGVKVKI